MLGCILIATNVKSSFIYKRMQVLELLTCRVGPMEAVSVVEMVLAGGLESLGHHLVH